MTVAQATEPLLRMEGIVKRFAGATALAGVDLTLHAGEVHALVGENGAGKSTLVKIMTGAYHRDGGRMWLEGREVDFDTPADAGDAGVTAVHQEIHLIGYRTVAENIFLGREPRRWGLIDWKRMNADAATLLAGLGIDVDPRATVVSLNTARRQMVAIARGVSLGAKVLVLDEPTSSLAEREVAVLYDLIRRLQSQGTAIVYISHRFDELYTVCNRVTILRDGKLVGTRAMEGLERLDLVCMMLGKPREELRLGTTGFGHAASAPLAESEPLLRAEGLRRKPKLQDVSFTVRKGEILGVAGLLGSGRTEMARAIFGATPAEEGRIEYAGRPFKPHGPGDGIAAGIGFLSEDRKAEGILPDLSIRENLTLAALPMLTKFGIVSRAKQTEIVERFMRRMGVKATSADQKIRELSGGNQQKVLLARWLCMQPKLLILDEPTRGIDIGAKAEIQALVNELAAGGLGVIMVSSELEELVEGSTRVIVLRDGQKVTELSRDQISQQAIIEAMAEGSAMDDPSSEATAPAGGVS